MSAADPYADVRSAWDTFLRYVEVVRHWQSPYAMNPGGLVPNPLLDQVHPSLLVLNLATVLDDSFELYIVENGIAGKHDRFAFRIDRLDENGRLPNTAQIRLLKDKRNELAHQQCFATWQELDVFVDEGYKSLNQLGIIATLARYEYFFERLPQPAPNEDIAIRFLFRFGVKREDQEAIAVESTVDCYRVGSHPPSKPSSSAP